jgi:hypothetical protein
MSHYSVTYDHDSGKTCCVNLLPSIGEPAGQVAANPCGERDENLAAERYFYSRSYERMLSKGYFVEWLALAW